MTTTYQRGFWPAAWELRDRCARSDISEQDWESTVEGLGQFVMQAYVFGQADVGTPQLLERLLSTSLFTQPPTEERFWPLVDLMRSQAVEAPNLVAEAMSVAGAHADSYSLERMLEIAVNLPAEYSASQCESLTEHWLQSERSWFDSRLWLQVIGLLIAEEPGVAGLLAAEVIGSAAITSSSDYEVGEFVSGLAELPLDNASDPENVARRSEALLDAVEAGIATAMVVSDSYTRRLPLADLRQSSSRDVLPQMVEAWLNLAEFAPSRLARACRLLASGESLLQQLGLRLLSSLAAAGRPEALRIANKLVVETDLLGRETRDEFLSLISKSFERLDETAQLGYLNHALGLAESQERIDSYVSRDMLGAIRNHIGPRERAVLKDLEAAMGEYEPGRPMISWSASWSESGDVESFGLANMGENDLLASMVRPPRSRSFYHGDERDAYEFRGAVRTQSSLRPGLFLGLVRERGHEVEDGSIHAAVVEGLGDVVGSESTEIDIAELGRYMNWVLSRFSTKSDEYVRRTVLWTCVKALEWHLQFPETKPLDGPALTQLSRCIRTGLGDASPAPEDELGWTSGDVMTAALNVNRAVATRGAFLLLQVEALGKRSGAVYQALIGQLESETSASVLSVFGRSLWQVWNGPSASLKATLVQRIDSDPSALDAIFAGYVVGTRPNAFDNVLHYLFARVVELRAAAVSPDDRDGLSPLPQLVEAWPSVLAHLVSNFVFGQEGTWWPVLERALGTSRVEEHAQALRTLTNAVRRSSEEARIESLLTLASHAETRARNPEASAVASAAVELLAESNGDIGTVGRQLIDLVRLAEEVPWRLLLPKLSASPEVAPAISAELLLRGIEKDARMLLLQRGDKDLAELLLTLGSMEATHARAVEAVNALGEQGGFWLESVAEELLGIQ